MSCKVDDSAIKKCRADYKAFLEVIKSREAERARQQRELALYQVQLAEWNKRHDAELRKRDEGRRIKKHGEIFHDGKLYDCFNVPHL